ncbi:MAG TPA: hypothetical protein VK731_09775 [Candidatus Cybelea sp.]|nr:hypothetical protein [Candidatus Cybelea sp.]
MNADLRKEIRLLLPPWIVALVAATLPIWLLRSDLELMEQISFIFFAAGALLLSLSSFGLEMSLGTFPSLLAQPRPRRATWRLKVGLLGMALSLVVVAAVFACWFQVHSIPPDSAQVSHQGIDYNYYIRNFWPKYVTCLVLLAVVAFVGGLWTTILIRQMVAAFWFAILVPLVLYAASLPVLKRLSEDDHVSFFMLGLGVLSCGYVATGYYLARWSFLHAQDKQAHEATNAATWSFLPAFATPRWPVMALFVKELRLQQAALSIAVVLALLHLAVLAAVEYLPAAMASNYSLAHDFWMVWCVAPLLVGCVSVAEERQGRTLESALCLPVGWPRQFAIKLLIALVLGMLFGAVIPWSLGQLQPAARGGYSSLTDVDLPVLLRTAVIITAVGCYVSSLCATLLQALGAAIGFCVIAPVALTMLAEFWLSNFENDWIWQAFAPAFVRLYSLRLLVWPALILVFFFLSYSNFKQARITWRQWVRNGAIWLAVFFAAPVFLFILDGLPIFIDYWKMFL